jgi:hypothetical protein
MEYDNEKEMIKEKLDFYLKNKVMVHIELKDKRFLNARIIEKESDNVYIISERLYGLMHLFVNEVYRISEYFEVKKDGK